MATESKVRNRIGYVSLTRPVVIVITLIVGSVLFTAYGGDEPEPIEAPAAAEDSGLIGPRTFKSEMPLEVWAMITEGDKWNVEDWEWKAIGNTPSDEPLQIPECVYWSISPKDRAENIDWEDLVDLIRRENIPGFRLPPDGSDQHISHLTGLENLWSLNLSRTGVTDEGLAHLAELSNLLELNLRYTNVTDEGLTHLSGLENLRELDLGSTDVTDDGLAHLSGLEDLRDLHLWETDVTDDGLAHLAGLENLRVLTLWETDVTDEGAQKLKDALPDLRVRK